MRLGEVPFASGIEQVLDSVEVEKERVAAAAGEKSVMTRLVIFDLPPKETSASAIIFVPGAPSRRDSDPVAKNTLTVCLPLRGSENT